MTFSPRDKIAVLAAVGLGLVFGYLMQQAPYAGLLVGGFYALGIIPLVVFYIADQRKFLVWQAFVISLVLVLVECIFSAPSRADPKETITFSFFFCIASSSLSSPTPLFPYLQPTH